MRSIGKKETDAEKADEFFKLILDKNIDDFDYQTKIATMSTCFRLLEAENIGEAPESIKINRVTYKLPKYLLDMQVKFMIELVNLELDMETFRHFHLCCACFYREDWSKPFTREEYFKNAKVFHDAQFIYSLWSLSMFDKLIVTLKNNYPILYESEGEEGKSDGRKMYDVLNALSNDDPTKQEQAENLPLWRAFTWLEQNRITQLNQKN